MNRFGRSTVSFVFLTLILFSACKHDKAPDVVRRKVLVRVKNEEKPIIDCNYTFEEAIRGSRAPENRINELELIDVSYYSTDKRLHRGQVLTNKRMVSVVTQMFKVMKTSHFPVFSAIPVVRYNWNDELSMRNNNSYSFCYRDISYSKHARGLAIDINPYYNPVIWKHESRPVDPAGAKYDLTVPGTFADSSEVVAEFKKMGLKWGRTFKKKYDNHHFEMR